MGYFAAGYAKVADLLPNPPVEVNIVAVPCSADELHRVALLLDAPVARASCLTCGAD